MFCSKITILPVLFLLLLISGPAARPAAAQTPAAEAGQTRVAILPFTMHTPANLSYLQSGIRDMLCSRLLSQGKMALVDRSEVDRAAAKGEKEISQSEALQIGSALRADYVLYGSVTSEGWSVSIDSKMTPVSGQTDPVCFYAQMKTLDDVMPQINIFAQQINQKIFGKPDEKSQAASTEAETLATRNPELLLPGATACGPAKSPGDVNETVPIQAENPQKPAKTR